MHDMYGMGFDPRLFALSAFPASYALELHRWDEAAGLPLVEGASDANQSITYTARAIAAARSGNFDRARKQISQLEATQKKLKAQKKTNAGDYEYISEEVTLSKAWLTGAEGRPDDAIRSLRGLADKAEGEAEASQGIPIRELIADMLFEAKRPKEALTEYEASLKTDPGRFDSLYGAARSAEQVGDHQKATEYYSELVKNCEGSTSERAELKHAREVIEAGTKASPRAGLDSTPTRAGWGE
jgi:tetratricopeptide (TPR) repeat protein